MTRARGVAHAEELKKKLNGIVPQPSPGVVKWRHTFGDDWAGDPAIFFWVTLSDEASKKENLSTTTKAFREVDLRADRFRKRLGSHPVYQFPERVGAGSPKR